MNDYPYLEGDCIVLGPEVIAAQDESVIAWKGDTYVPRSRLERTEADLEVVEANREAAATALVHWSETADALRSRLERAEAETIRKVVEFLRAQEPLGGDQEQLVLFVDARDAFADWIEREFSTGEGTECRRTEAGYDCAFSKGARYAEPCDRCPQSTGEGTDG